MKRRNSDDGSVLSLLLQIRSRWGDVESIHSECRSEGIDIELRAMGPKRTHHVRFSSYEIGCWTSIMSAVMKLVRHVVEKLKVTQTKEKMASTPLRNATRLAVRDSEVESGSKSCGS